MSSKRRRLDRLVGLAVVVAFGAAVGLAQPRPVAAWDSGAYSSASERELISRTNRSRAAAGLRSLRVDSTLTSVARWRSRDMIDRDYFSHDIPGYGDVFKRLDQKGYCYVLAGENIGWNTYPDGEATAAIHGMFMDSAGHRKNVLGRKWEAIGVGAFKGSDGKKMWTVLFADHCGSTAKATSKPTVRATPAPKPRATPKPTPRPTSRPTPAPTPAPTPSPTPSPTPPPHDLGPPLLAHRAVIDDRASGLPTTQATTSTGLRVATSTASPGLLDAVVGRVAGAFFGT